MQKAVFSDVCVYVCKKEFKRRRGVDNVCKLPYLACVQVVGKLWVTLATYNLLQPTCVIHNLSMTCAHALVTYAYYQRQLTYIHNVNCEAIASLEHARIFARAYDEAAQRRTAPARNEETCRSNNATCASTSRSPVVKSRQALHDPVHQRMCLIVSHY